MEEKCLYQVKSRDYVIKKIEPVIIFLHLFMAFLVAVAFSVELAFAIVFLGILIYFLLLKKMIGKAEYTKIKFYSDKLCLVGQEEKYINYTDIKAIMRSKGIVYIIIKDKEECSISNLEEVIEYNQIIKLDNSAYSGYPYNKVKEITKANDLYSIGMNMLKEKEQEMLLKFEKKCNMISEYIELFIATAGIVTLLYALSFALDMFIPLNKDDIVLFLCISFVATLIICWKNFKFNKKTIHTYEFYNNYFMEINNKTSFQDKIQYLFVTKLKIRKNEKNKYNVCIEFLRHRLIMRYQYVEKVLLSDVTAEEVEKIKGLIRKEKNM